MFPSHLIHHFREGNMNYYSHILHFPNAKPFDRTEFRWMSFVGEFVAPLMRNQKDLYWCSYYGGFARFRLYTDCYDQIKPRIDSMCSTLGLTRDDSEKELTLVGDLGHSRFLASNSTSNSQNRAELVLRYLHSVSELLVDSIQKGQDGYWVLEKNTNQENPHQNSFESLAHLLANMTEFQFDVSVTLRTAWMPQELGGSATLHL